MEVSVSRPGKPSQRAVPNSFFQRAARVVTREVVARTNDGCGASHRPYRCRLGALGRVRLAFLCSYQDGRSCWRQKARHVIGVAQRLCTSAHRTHSHARMQLVALYADCTRSSKASPASCSSSSSRSSPRPRSRAPPSSRRRSAARPPPFSGRMSAWPTAAGCTSKKAPSTRGVSAGRTSQTSMTTRP